jgi:alginate O-acetyltransferase complex protein AlgI
VLAASYAFSTPRGDYRLLVAAVGLDAGRLPGSDASFRAARTCVARRWLAISIVVNLAFLGFFKYYDFFAESAMALAHSLGFAADLPLLRLILPVGISFYTFMSMSYTHRRLPRTTRREELPGLRFVRGVLPALGRGRFLRASQFLVQFYEKKRWADVDVRSALVIFLVGFVKKACVADNVAPVVDQYFADPAAFDAVSAAIAVVCYAVQIYCDFSG